MAAGELFKTGSAQLYLVDGDESALLQCGEFTLLLAKNSRSPLAAVVAKVGDMQWPLGKDCLVSRLGDTGFTFSNLPARLKYALSLDNIPDRADVQKLELLFQEYSNYVQADMDATQAAASFWTRLARNMDKHTLPDALSGISTLSAVQKRGMVNVMSPNLVQRTQQARRMSAVAKLFARSVEQGTINASTHVKKSNTDVHITDLALASVDAVAKVVDAVETAGKTLLESAQAAGSDILAESKYSHNQSGKEVSERLDTVGNLISSAWTLNKVGLRMLFRTIASINSSVSTRTVSQTSSISTDATGRSSSNSDSRSVSSTSSMSPGTSGADNSTPLMHGTSLSLGALSMQSTSCVRPGGITLLPMDGSRRCLPAAERSLRPSRQISPPMLPLHFTDRAAPQSPPLPPRFFSPSTASDHDHGRGGVTTALSLASGGSAMGPASPSLHVYRPSATQLQAHQRFAMPMPPPPPPRPPPPRSRPPFY